MRTTYSRTNFGGFSDGDELSDINLVSAYSGSKTFNQTCWNKLKFKYWVIDYLNRGTQELKIGKKKFLRTSNIAILYAKDTEYCEFEKDGQSVDESYLFFTLKGDIHEKFKTITKKSGYCCFGDPDNIIGNNLEKLSKFLFFRPTGYRMFAYSVFTELLGLLDSAIPQKTKLREVRLAESEENNIFTKTCEYVIQHICEDITIADLAAHLMMSESSFAHRYPEIARETPLFTINRLKIEKAKHMLIGQHCSVKEISAHLGFSSEFHFSRVFKRVEGIPPSTYRTNLIRK